MIDQVASTQSKGHDPFAGSEIASIAYATPSQAEIWASCQLGSDDANRAYNESISVKLRGELNEKALERALKEVISRHESLRTVFSTDGRIMSILQNLPFTLKKYDYSHLESNSAHQEIQKVFKEGAEQVFDLVKGPLFSTNLVKLADSVHYLTFWAHHIICDGWSLGIVMQEISALYSFYHENRGVELPQPIPFRQYSKEQLSTEIQHEHRKSLKYWVEQFKETAPQYNLPLDFERPVLRTYESKRIDLELNPQLLAQLKKTGLRAGCTLVTTLLSTFEIFLLEETRQEDLVVGLPVAGQSMMGMHQLVGHCVNVLPLRSNPRYSISFNDYLKERKSDFFDAYEHYHISFGELLQNLNIARDASRVPLVPIMFNIDLGMEEGIDFSGLQYELSSCPRSFETFDLFLNLSGTDKKITFEWQYNTNLFRSDSIKRMMASMEKLVEKLVENPSKPLQNLLNQDFGKEYEVLNETDRIFPQLALHELIFQNVDAYRKKIAVRDSQGELTYEMLANRVNSFSCYFQNHGIRKGDVVGVSLSHSKDLVSVLLALSQCGAAYLPLDPDYPNNRLKYMIEDSGAEFIISDNDNSLLGLHSHIHRINLNDIDTKVFDGNIHFPVVSPDENVYMLYTSGSTGKPKGVPISHKNLVNFLCSMEKEPGITRNDKLLSITTISFDIAGLELFLPLMKGATLYLTNRNTAKDGRLLLDFIEENDINYLQATPSTWQMLLDAGWTKRIPLKALSGGEALSLKLAKELLEKCDELWNMYGPTETTIWSTIKKVEVPDTVVTIGKPIANTQIYLLNETGELVTPGKIGEICIGGAGVAEGYWKRPELTNDKFVKMNVVTNETLYKTGDLGRLLPNGEIECLGRVDQQIKVRGHRIEPGEIEATLEKFEVVKKTVVIGVDNRLVAFVTVKSAIDASEIQEMKKSLSRELPQHLVPQEIKVVPQFPFTLNGKIDKKELVCSYVANNSLGSFTEPRTPEETLVAKVWKECLGLDKIDIYSDFFELGGHSLIAVRVMAALEKTIEQRLPLSSLFQHSTIEKFAKLLSNKEKSEVSWSSLVPIKPEGSKPPLFLIHGAGLNILRFNNLVKYFEYEQPVYGLQGASLEETAYKYDTLEKLAALYIQEIKCKFPSGPYALAGYSFGGYLAFEMSRQLKENGDTVSMTGVVDSYIEPLYYHKNKFKRNMAKLIYRGNWLFTDYLKIISNKEYRKKRIEGKKYRLKEKYTKKEADQKVKEEQEYLDRMMRINLQIKARDNYQITMAPIHVDVFRATDPTDYMHDTKLLGWGEVAGMGVDVHDIPGNHSDILALPNAEKTVMVLQKVLDQRNALKKVKK